MRNLVLASTSSYRRALMQRLHVPFSAVDPLLDETPFKNRGLPPEVLVSTLAEAKARAACALAPADAVIIGADQCAELDGTLLGKPSTVQGAIDQLSRLAGRTHRLLTGLCVFDPSTDTCQVHVDVHQLKMRALSPEQIAHYVAVDEPMNCAGGFKIESLGVALFERVEGADPTAIIGLPLMMLCQMLERVGIDVLRAD